MQDRWITDWEPSERFPFYTRANAGEVMNDPISPLGWTFVVEPMTLGWRDGYVRQGLYDLDEFDEAHPEVCGHFGGYFFINLSNVRMQGVRNPNLTVEALDQAFFGGHPDVPPYRPHPDDDRPDLVPKIEAHMGWLMTAEEYDDAEEYREITKQLRRDRPDLSSLTSEELVARAREVQPLIAPLFEHHTVTSSSSGVAPGILGMVGAAIGDPGMAMRAVAGMGDVDSAEPSYALWELSRRVRASGELTAAFDAGLDGLLDRLATGGPDAAAFLEAWDGFLEEFGSRGPNEWDLVAATWETRPRIALAALDRIRLQEDEESPNRRNQARASDREAVVTEVREKLAGNDELTGAFEAALAAAHALQWRERTKTNIIRAIGEIRVAFLELGERMAAAGHLAEARHVYMLLDDELDDFVADPGAGWRERLAEREAEWKELFALEPPFIIGEAGLPPLTEWARKGDARPPQAQAGDVLQGVAGCPGVARGRARVILDPSDPTALEPGDVLVAPNTDPAWTPLFMPASAVVVNVGGQISHSIIVSRELGLPCVVSVTGATEVIPHGAMVEVDGTAGTVTILE